MDQRAKQSVKKHLGLPCCQFVKYILTGAVTQVNGGAAGWLKYGSATNNPAEAVVIVVTNQNGNKHVGYVTDNGNTVIDIPGYDNRPVRMTNFN